MGDFAGILPFGGGGVPIRSANDTPKPAIQPVAGGSKGQGASARMDQGRAELPFIPRSRERGAGRDEYGPHVLTGPTPAFQASVLEMERDLKQTIARLEAARGKQESDVAMGVLEQTEAPEDAESAEATAEVAAPETDTPETEAMEAEATEAETPEPSEET